jgi:hypothetical protein
VLGSTVAMPLLFAVSDGQQDVCATSHAPTQHLSGGRYRAANDAVAATVASLTTEPGLYNVVDDDPLPVSEWLPAFARWVDAPQPLRISAERAEGGRRGSCLLSHPFDRGLQQTRQVEARFYATTAPVEGWQGLIAPRPAPRKWQGLHRLVRPYP